MNKKFVVYYMISDPPDRKHIPKLPYATKINCLNNFLEVFDSDIEKIILCADNISDELRHQIYEFDIFRSADRSEIRGINGGCQAKAFQSVLELVAGDGHTGDTPILIQEDDYLYLWYASHAMLEALEYGHYVTGYLHPDKFMDPSKGGNPSTYADNISEETRVIKTASHFWMMTNSTTCTFAATAQTITEDLSIWKQYIEGRNVTEDFNAFLELRRRNRSVLMPIPTLATHAMPQWLAPLLGTDCQSWQDVI